jgi:hypothetical protein
MLQLIYKEPSSGWQGTKEKLLHKSPYIIYIAMYMAEISSSQIL